MQSSLDEPAISKLTKARLNIPANSLIRITTIEGHVAEGTLLDNPYDTTETDRMVLVNCWNLVGSQKLQSNQIRLKIDDVTEGNMLMVCS